MLASLPIKYETADFCLKLLQSEDSEAYYAMTNDPVIANIISFLSYPVHRAVTDKIIEDNNGSNDRVYGIWDGPILLGQIGAHRFDEKTVEVGYWIGTAFTGKGLGTKALKSMVELLQLTLPTIDIVAECLPDNTGSMAVLNKCGFTNTGLDGHRAGRVLLRYQANA